MKKLIFLLNLTCIYSSVFGTYAAWVSNKFERNSVHKPIRNDREAASSSSSVPRNNEANSTELSVSENLRESEPQIGELERSDNAELLKIDPLMRNQIRKFSRNFKSPIYSSQTIEKALIDYASYPNESIQKIAERNKLPSSTLYWWKSHAGFSLRRTSTIQEESQKRVNSSIKEKIRDFSLGITSKNYSAKQVEKALIEYISLFDHSIENIAKSNGIPNRTLSDWISKLNLNSRFYDRHRREIEKEQKLIDSLNQGIKWGKFHRAIGKKRNAAINTLRRLQDKGQIEINLTEEKKDRIIKDFREKVLTNKGIARKHNIKESDIYCVIHEARSNKKDLSTIKMKWKVSINKSQLVPEEQKKRMVKDYNKGLLTFQGICVKHEVSVKTAQTIIYAENSEYLKRRNGKQRITKEFIYNLMNKSNREIEKQYGYKSIYIDELKRYIKQWVLLTDDQKNLFRSTMRTGIMPAEDVISSVQKSSIGLINGKFERMLFVLGASYEDIMGEYGITRKGANRLKRASEFWKILSKQNRISD